MKFAILGHGIFGSAIASRLVLNGHQIIKEEIEKDTDIVLVAVPSYAVSNVLISHKSEILNNQRIIICSKGFDKSGELFSKVLEKEFPNNQIYFLYGPTLAGELQNGVFSVMVLAGGAGKEELKKAIELPDLRIQLSDDIIGVQVGSALKNTVGIFVGLVEGAGLGENTQGFVYSQGLQEIQKIGVYMGAKPETFLGFTCAGDLFVRSRSRMLGVEIGKGRSFEEVAKEMVYPKEGIASLLNILKMDGNPDINLNFFKLIHSVVFEGMKVEEAVKKLADMI
jgi:glycerol-3-phosphate dehydrogenase (NAD(P)+)